MELYFNEKSKIKLYKDISIATLVQISISLSEKPFNIHWIFLHCINFDDLMLVSAERKSQSVLKSIAKMFMIQRYYLKILNSKS